LQYNKHTNKFVAKLQHQRSTTDNAYKKTIVPKETMVFEEEKNQTSILRATTVPMTEDTTQLTRSDTTP
jgi:hypothetical protein